MQEWLLKVVLAAALSCLCSSVSTAQATRPLTVSVDSLTMNLCADKTFTIPVRIGDLLTSDSVSGFEIAIRWDVAHISLQFPYYIASSGTLAYQAKDRSPAQVDPDNGNLVISAGNVDGSLIVGSGKPLLYLVGKVTAPDTVGWLNGWIEPFSFQTEGLTNFTPITYHAGLVHVEQDTTAAYTGSLSFSGGDFDVRDLDTVSLIVQNVRDRRVSEINVALKADTSYFKIVGTVETGTLSESVSWSVKSVTYAADTLLAQYVSPTALTSDGALLKVILHRTTDSAFDRSLVVNDFSVNSLSCLGKLVQENGEVTASGIVDTTSAVVEEENGVATRRIDVVRIASNVMRVISEGSGIDEVRVFDGMGRLITTHSAGNSGDRSVTIQLEDGLPSGVYFMMIRGGNDLVYKQFTLIK